MALDEPRENDKRYETDGITWIVDPDDEQRVMGEQGVRVDHSAGWFGGGGFIIRPVGEPARSCC